MKNYEKPILVHNDEAFEGVYAASGAMAGSDCYTVTARIHQTPQTGREDYRIQVTADHAAVNHHSTGQVLVVTFNQPVNFSACYGNGAQYVSGNGTNTLKISYTYHNNLVEQIGMGDLVVTSADGLAVTGAVLYCNYKCDQHDHLGNY